MQTRLPGWGRWLAFLCLTISAPRSLRGVTLSLRLSGLLIIRLRVREMSRLGVATLEARGGAECSFSVRGYRLL